VDWALLLLLLPVAYYFGYQLGQQREKPSDSASAAQPHHYLDGLNYLLNEEQDKAIALLEQLPDEQTERFETQLALGNLFRRRGELERAIRLHQNLSTRPLLSTEQRAQALAELGEDFMRAGLLDRAESLFIELNDIDRPTPRTLRALMSIYEQERDWPKAIAAATRLQNSGDADAARVIAHYHCEIAAAALAKQELSTAAQALGLADAVSPRALRVLLLRAELALQSPDPELELAAQLIKDLAEINPAFIEEALGLLDKLVQLERKRDASAAISSALRNYLLTQERGNSTALLHAKLLQDEQGSAAALQFLQDKLRQAPQPRVLAQWLVLKKQQATQPNACIEENADLFDWSAGALQIARGSALTHRCQQCGFGTTALHWQCPSCKSWDSCQPIVRL
jgi:lipopolysaccharide assembly protein B